MKDRKRELKRILALYPSTYGAAFAVFESPEVVLEFGIKQVGGVGKARSRHTLSKVEGLITAYRPHLIVTEDWHGHGSRRGRRMQRVLEGIVALAQQQGITVELYGRLVVQSYFLKEFGVYTKHYIARAIARRFPEFEPKVPPTRKIWRAEDPRMHIFDAASLGMTHYFVEKNRKK